MKSVKLEAKTREIKGRKNHGLRQKGFIPAVLYGHGLKNKLLEISRQTFEKIYQKAGESSLIDLVVDRENPIKVLIYDVQCHPLSEEILHVDFYKVKTGEKITTEVELKFEGVSPAVKELGGTLVINLPKIEIKCLPQDLIHEIPVNISKLTTFDDFIRIKDLSVPTGIEITRNLEEAVAHVVAPRAEKIEVEEEKPVVEIEGKLKEGEVEERKEGGGEKSASSADLPKRQKAKIDEPR